MEPETFFIRRLEEAATRVAIAVAAEFIRAADWRGIRYCDSGTVVWFALPHWAALMFLS